MTPQDETTGIPLSERDEIASAIALRLSFLVSECGENPEPAYDALSSLFDGLDLNYKVLGGRRRSASRFSRKKFDYELQYLPDIQSVQVRYMDPDGRWSDRLNAAYGSVSKNVTSSVSDAVSTTSK